MSDSPLQGHARLAGLMYLVVMASFIAPYAMISAIVVPGDFAQTARNVAASETLYRAALVIQALGCAAIIVLSGALYALLHHLNAPLALWALLLRVAEAIVLVGGVVIRFAALKNYLSVDATGLVPQRETLSQLMSATVGASSYVAFIFLAVGSLVFFFLLYRSRFVPRLLAAFDILAALLMLILACAYLLLPARVSGLGMLGMAPMFLAEVGTGLWLLVASVSSTHTPVAAPEGAP